MAYLNVTDAKLWPVPGKPLVALERLAQSYALITAALFLASVVVNAVWMGVKLGVPYTAVATPTDVLMNGVQALGPALLIVLMHVAFLRATPRLHRSNRLHELRAWRVTGEPGFPPGYRRNRPFLEVWIARFMLVVLAIGLLHTLWASTGQRSNLYYLSGGAVPESCSLAPVEWMGSQSAIIDCNGRRHVIRDGENVVLVQGDRTCVGAVRVRICEDWAPGSRAQS